jgi:hypothetical protein
MAKLTTFTDLGKVTDPQEFIRFAAGAFIEMQSIINGKIEFDSNIASQTKTVYFPTANLDVSINHTLGKSSINYLVAQKTGPCDIYNGSVATTESIVNLRSNASGVTVTLILY